jgi:FkbM family methyltransferase
MNITGIIHVGAHHGQELQIYKNAVPEIQNIVFFEADPSNFDVLQQTIKNNADNNTTIRSICTGIGSSECEMELYKSDGNKGQCNSLLKPKLHVTQYPSIVFDKTIKIKVEPLDKYNFGPVYNFLNMDIQGFELEALKGAKKTLENIKWIMTEVNRDELYENCAQITEIDEYLKQFNFVRKEVYWAGGTWGDALYVKEEV